MCVCHCVYSCATDPEIANLESYSVHAVAAAVGGFFRELPEPLLTRDMYMEFLRAMGRCGHGCGHKSDIGCSLPVTS